MRQSYHRVGEILLMQQSRYTHARQARRARACQRKLHTLLGRVIRDVQRKMSGVKLDPVLTVLLSVRNASMPSNGMTKRSSRACMPLKWSASAKAKRTSVTSLASK